MKTFKSTWWLVLGLFFLIPQSGAWADKAPAKGQDALADLFHVKLDIQPTRLFGLPVKRVVGDIPVSVITDAYGEIKALQLGGAHTKIINHMKDGSQQEDYFATVTLPIKTIQKKTYKVDAKLPVRGNIELFYVNALGLNAKSGGDIEIRYTASPVLGTTNDFKMKLYRKNGKWMAQPLKASGDRSIASALVETGLFGMGFNKPKVNEMDPNQLTRVLHPVAYQDPRVSQRMIKQGEEMIEYLESGATNQFEVALKVKSSTLRQ